MRRSVTLIARKNRFFSAATPLRREQPDQQQPQQEQELGGCPFMNSPRQSMQRPKHKRPHELPGRNSLSAFLQVFRPKYLTQSHLLQIDEHEAFGDVIKTRLGNHKIVSLNQPRLVADLFRKEGHYPRRIPMDPWKDWRIQRQYPNALITSEGHEWFENRQLSNKQLMRPQEINQFLPEIDTTASEAVRRLLTIISRNKRGGVIDDMPTFAGKWAFESTANILFGTRMGCLKSIPPPRTQQFIDAVDDMTKETLVLMFLYSWHKKLKSPWYRKFLASWDIIHDVTMEKVSEFEQRVSASKDANPVTAGNAASVTEEAPEVLPVASYMMSRAGFSRERTLANIAELLLGGVDTTSNALMWAIYEISRNPEAQRALYEEALQIVPSASEGKLLTAESLKQMSIVKDVVKETLRLWPTIPQIIRKLNDDIELELDDDTVLFLPKGTNVQIPNVALGKDRRNFFAPHRFLPERWRRNDVKTKEDQRFAWVPFGHGSRSCIGRRLAELELYVVLLRLSREFEMAPLKTPTGEMVELGVKTTTVIQPKVKDVFPVIFKARN